MKSAVEVARALSLELEIDQLRDEVRALRADARRHGEEREVLRARVIVAARGGAVCARCGSDPSGRGRGARHDDPYPRSRHFLSKEDSNMTVQIKSRIPGLFHLPDEYGGKLLQEGDSIYVNDSVQNVAALLGNPNPSAIELRIVSGGQAGEIVPATASAGKAGSYSANPTSNWAGAAPTTVADALDRLATKVKALNGNVAIP